MSDNTTDPNKIKHESTNATAKQENVIKLFGYPITESRPFIILIQLLLVLWIFTWIGLMLYSDNSSIRGQLGDMFGVFTSLMSGLTFAGLIYTILLQRQQMNQQRDEINLARETLYIAKEDLEATKTELKISNDQFAIQNKTLQKQQFESLFFNLIKLHNDTVASFGKNIGGDVPEIARHFVGKTQYDGKEVFQYLDQKLKHGIGKLRLGSKDDVPTMEQSFEVFYHREEPLLSRYLRSLLTLLRYVDESTLIDDKSKELYFRIITAYFSEYEIRVLYYTVLLSPISPGIGIPNLKWIYFSRKLYPKKGNLFLIEHVRLLIFAKEYFGLTTENMFPKANP